MAGSNKLSALKVEKARKPGRYCDGGGLYLQVTRAGTKSWALRFMREGQARQMGLGSAELLGLQEARERARDARKQLKIDGVDPIDARKRRRLDERLTAARSVTFQNCAERYIAGHEAGWRNQVHRKQWKATLATYVYPEIGKLPVSAIDTALVLRILEPIWHAKAETAGRVRGRIESILDWATARSYRQGDNPARWRGHLDKLLPSRRNVATVRHHPALPYKDVPDFSDELRGHDGISAQALEFLLLTAMRTGEVIGATWDEIDMSERLWRVPASRMKKRRPHTVPLSDRALAILAALPRIHGCLYLFPGMKAGKSLSNMAMLELMRELRPGFVPHGLRSTFRDWAAECTAHPAWVAEAALAHVVADKVEAAYRRGELLEKRRALMEDWARHCGGANA